MCQQDMERASHRDSTSTILLLFGALVLRFAQPRDELLSYGVEARLFLQNIQHPTPACVHM